MKKIALKGIIALVVIVVLVLGFKACSPKEGGIEVESSKVEKEDVSNTITATGTIEAITTVQVGTQVSGVIKKLYVDFNQYVKKGQLLAQIDETMLRAQLNQAEAQVASAKAEETFQKANYDRTKALWEKNLISKSDYDQALYNYSRAKASLTSAESEYQRSRTNLSYASIYSPIDGVVLNRAVDEGQTVAASFNTPEIFTIANDLTQMEVQADVDEADIGQIKLNQTVDFTVDAFPDDHFQGKVTEIRLKPTVTSNVVTYTVIIQAQNPEKKLMPGMTASVNIIVESAKDALTISSKALKFWPDETMIPLLKEPLTKKESETGQTRTIWTYDGQMLHKKTVTIGINDGTKVQVINGISEKDEIVTSVKVTQSGKKSSGSPFMPKPPMRDKKK